MLGRDADAIAFIQRSLTLNPDASAIYRQNSIRQMACAYARMGEIDKAHAALAEANRIWPFDTVRGHWPEDPTNAVYADQIRSYQEGLRRAGLRDHADEDADFRRRIGWGTASRIFRADADKRAGSANDPHRRSRSVSGGAPANRH
jgi:tetratricopeptide (TPR) repeat protein